MLDDLSERPRVSESGLDSEGVNEGEELEERREFLIGRQSCKEAILLLWMKFERIEYSDHAIKRMKQRGMTELEIEHVLTYPTYVKKSYLGRKEAVGTVKNRTIKVAFEEIESYIRIVSVM